MSEVVFAYPLLSIPADFRPIPILSLFGKTVLFLHVGFPVHSKVLPRPAQSRHTKQKHNPSLLHSESKNCLIQLRDRFAIESATRHLCSLLLRSSCCWFPSLLLHVLPSSSHCFSCFSSYVCLWCSCLFRCFLLRSFLLLLVVLVVSVQASFSKVLFESAARNRRSK